MAYRRDKAAVLGGGAWGTVFAQILADAGNDVTIWARRQELADQINRGENPRYVPGIRLNGLKATSDLQQVIGDARLIVVAVPSHTVRDVVGRVKADIPLHATLISLVKGLEADSLEFMHQVIAEAAEVSPSRVVAVSGPNLSAEIAQKEPTGAVCASSDAQRAGLVAAGIHTHYFRPFVSNDVIGVETGGVVKNVIAMAVGAATGLGFGTNSKSFLITRGLAEMARLGIALGGSADTFLGMAGLGDLVATCSSEKSRNFTFGNRLGQGMSVKEALDRSVGVVEGQRSCEMVLELARQHHVSMPITRAASQVLSGEKTVEEIQDVLSSGPRVTDGIEARVV